MIATMQPPKLVVILKVTPKQYYYYESSLTNYSNTIHVFYGEFGDSSKIS